MTDASIEPFAKAHLDELIALVAAEGWAEYADDVERTYRALTAPGVTTLVGRGRWLGFDAYLTRVTRSACCDPSSRRTRRSRPGS